jgi:hypothetical protein
MMRALFQMLGAGGAAALLAGCGSLPKIRFTRYGAPPAPVAAAAPVAAPVVPAGIPVPDERVVTPGLRKAYYVGQMIDPAHPELMYRPGIVYRQEVPERWNRNPTASRGTVAGVIAAVPDPAVLPPGSPELEQLVAQQRRVLELLSETNADLRRQLAGEPAAASSKAPTAATAPATAAPAGQEKPDAKVESLPPASPPQTRAAPADLARALVPNADHAIELSPEILDAVDRSEPNPFVKRFQPQTAFRDLLVTVSGTSLGPRPTASVNGRLLNPGEVWEGFTVAAITRDAVFLRKDGFLLQIPVARTRGVTVRLPH